MALTHEQATRDAIAQALLALGTADAFTLVLKAGATTICTCALTGSRTTHTVTFTQDAGSAGDEVATGGTIDTFEVRSGTSSGAIVFGGTVGTSGEDITMTSTTVSGGDKIAITTLTWTAPE